MSEEIRDRQQLERVQSGVAIPGNPKISMVIACYENHDKILLPLASCINQSYTNWEAVVVHDGPGGFMIQHRIRSLQEPRISFYHLPEKSNDWGNSNKEYGSQLCAGDYIAHSNDDNFYSPIYFEWMLRAMIEQQADFAYCNMVHSHRQYQPMSCEPRACMIDGGGWIAKAEIVKSTPWPEPKNHSHADGYYIEAMVSKCKNITHVPGYLFTHN